MNDKLEALVRLGRYHIEKDDIHGFEIQDTEDYDLVEKSLKALEVIKNKRVNVSNLIEYELNNDNSYEEYLDDYKYADNYFELGKELLTEEEYDLLKEIFDE